jgi:hypothetical protein
MFRKAILLSLTGIGMLTANFAVAACAQTAQEQEAAKETAPANTEGTKFPLDSLTDFSAIMVGSQMEIGEGESTAYIYRSGNLMRMTGQEGHGYFITDLKTLETYGISAGPCAHDTHPFMRVSPFAATVWPGVRVEHTPVRTETLDGHSCHVEDVAVYSKDHDKPAKMRFWEADDLQGFPIKIEYMRPGGHNPIVRYKNVVIGPQDPTLFIHPKDCEPLPKAPAKKAATGTPAAKKPAAPPAPK